MTYYINSFISGLSDYIQAHLQCHKPENMQQAMWMAKRIQQANPQRKQYSQQSFFPRRQVNFEVNTTPATAIELAKSNNQFYKCKEPWFPGHKKICKMAQKAQVQALQTADAEIVYIRDF
jgi:hypothetical protein